MIDKLPKIKTNDSTHEKSSALSSSSKRKTLTSIYENETTPDISDATAAVTTMPKKEVGAKSIFK